MFIGVVKRLKEMDSTESAVFDLKKSWKQMTSDNVYIFVPNIIGYIRLALLVVAFVYAQDNHVLAVTCYLVSAFLDEFDGYCARRLGQTSLYGQQLDEITDELATMGIASVLCYFYPKYIWFYQLLIAVDIAGHWAHMHNAEKEQFPQDWAHEPNSESLLDKCGTRSQIDDNVKCLTANFKTAPPKKCMKKRYGGSTAVLVLAPLWVYGNHVFLAMSYLCFFTEGPLLTVFGYAVGVFKLLLWLSAPWSISRGMINGVMAVEAFRSFARMDVSRRLEQRHSQNGQAVPVQNGVTVTGRDHKD